MSRNIPAFLFLSFFLFACTFSNGAYSRVKKSTSGICHDTSSSSYNRTKNYETFSAIEACLESGCRLPKARSAYKQAEKEAVSEGRAFTIDYDRADWPHWIDGDCQNTSHGMLISRSYVSVEKPIKSVKSP